MRLDISEILSEVGKHLPYVIHEPPLVDEHVECTRPIEGRITFSNTGGTLLVRGGANTVIALPCSRCAVYFEQPMSFHIDEQFELRHISAGPRTLQTVTVVEEDESPIAGKLFDGHVFNLTELLRQYILVEAPTRPLPPVLGNEHCAHCGRRLEDVLAEVNKSAEPDEPVLNPAFAKLGELLNQEHD